VLLRPWVKLFFGLNVVGRENLSRLDRFILIANHNSHLDILLIFCLLPWRLIPCTRPVADRDYFHKRRSIFHLVTFVFNPVWVARGEADRHADPLGEMKALLENGGNLIIFPEGTRGKPGEMERFKSGIGRLATSVPDLPIVPVFLSGPERALPKTGALPLPFWNNVVVGPPQPSLGTHRDITRSLESILCELSRSASAGRHKRQPSAEQPAVCVAFLGIDGSGKSTLSKRVAETLSEQGGACRISDRFECYEKGSLKEIQPLLTEEVRRFISRRAKKAKSLKSYKIPKLTELLLRNHLHYQARRWYLPRFIVLDGSPLLNLVAWAVLYKGRQVDEEACGKAVAILTGQGPEVRKDDPIFARFPELSVLRRLPTKRLVLPEVVLFLDVPPAEACRRIESRGEHQQVHETEEKLTKLRDAYLMVCQVITKEFNVPAGILSGEASREQVTAEALSFLESSCRHGEKESTE
jgi:1-acyl-sn-glycerol-3-phosphate acyltransferase